MAAGQFAVQRDTQRRQVLGEDFLEAVMHAAPRAVGETAQAHRAWALPGETVQQLPEATFKAVVGLADVFQNQDRHSQLFQLLGVKCQHLNH